MDELTTLLKTLAGKQTAVEVALEDGEEYFSPYEASGGNFDDAYYMGTEDGQIQLARTVLAHLEGQ